MAETAGGWLGFAEVVALRDSALAGDLEREKCAFGLSLKNTQTRNEVKRGSFQMMESYKKNLRCELLLHPCIDIFRLWSFQLKIPLHFPEV